MGEQAKHCVHVIQGLIQWIRHVTLVCANGKGTPKYNRRNHAGSGADTLTSRVEPQSKISKVTEWWYEGTVGWRTDEEDIDHGKYGRDVTLAGDDGRRICE